MAWCLVEVFILMGLRGCVFVSVVDARVTGTDLAKMCTSVKNRVDSIGVAEGDVGFLGSADSKGVTGRGGFWENVGTHPPGVFGKECAELRKERGWAEL